jgi:prevent-host-death family protein
MDDKPIAEARANLSDLIAHVRIGRTMTRLTSRDKPSAAIVPVELADAAEAVGGADAAAEILRTASKNKA